MNIWLTLFLEFFKTGLFSVGGGLATIPFLTEMMERYHWFTEQDLLNMIAISESTPGPIGVNMATYVGYQATGNNILGGIWATIALVLPSVIIICVIAQLLKTYKNNPIVQNAFYGLRPASCALIFSAVIGVLASVLFPSGQIAITPSFWMTVGLMLIFGGITLMFKKMHPIALIVICAITGIVLQL